MWACTTVNAQVGIGTTNPNASAALDVSASDKGLLVPRMTHTQRESLANPATGLLVIQTDEPAGFYYNAGTPASPNWLNLSTYTLQQNINTNGKYISGDGTKTGIQVGSNGFVMATGYYSGVNTNTTQSTGAQMIWTPNKAAFRAGYISGSSWDDVNIGRWSMAMGYNTRASGTASFAAGYRSIASGSYSLGLGYSAEASGISSVAVGSYVSTNNMNGSMILGDSRDAFPNINSANNQMVMRFGGGYQLFASPIATPAIAVDAQGKVGIGKESPAEVLDVSGNITYSGTLNMGVQIVSRDYTVSGNSRGDYNCGCPAGTKLIGGGGGHRDWNSALNDIELAYNGPHLENLNFWRIMVQNTSGSSRAVRVYAICAKVK